MQSINNILRYLHNNFIVCFIFTLMIAMFISWLFSGFNFFNVISSSAEFQSIHSWLPLTNSMKLGYLFPSQPSIDITEQAFMFYPYLTLWIYAIMAWLVGMKGIIIISAVIFPTCSFYLLYRIFSRQLNGLWSIAISLTCILAFSDWPFRSFLIGIIRGLPLNKLVTNQPLEIALYPIPSFSVMIFLLVFYLSTKQVKLTFSRVTLYTSLWGLFIHVHTIDAIYGLAFWFIYFPIQIFRQTGKQISNNFMKIIVPQILIGILFIAPIIFSWKTSTYYNSIEKIGLITSKFGESIDLFYLAAYFFLPLTLTFIVFLVKKVDSYEILIKFIHVYILQFVEFVIVLSNILISKSFEIDIIQTRIALFFLHFYYYTPFIYLVTRSIGYTYSHGIEANQIMRKFENGLNFVFNRLDKIYLPIIFVSLFIFSGNSSYQNYIHHKSTGGAALEEIIYEYNKIIKILPKGSVFVSETPGANLIPPIDFKN